MRKFRIYLVVALTICSLALAANPTSKAKSVIEAKKVLFQDLEKKLNNELDLSDLESYTETNFVVYGMVDVDNKLIIHTIVGNNDFMKNQIESTLEDVQIESSDYLKGEYIAFRLKLKNM